MLGFDQFNLLDRTVSGFPLSISTGLAMESIFTPIQAVYDQSREPPIKEDIRKYTHLWVNTATLFRNMVSASSPLVVLESSHDEIEHVLIQEMEVIQSLLAHEGMGVCKAHFYHVDYSSVFQFAHKSIKQRSPESAPRKQIEDRYTHVIKSVRRKTNLVVKESPKLSPPAQCSALMLTHHPYDLLSYKRFHQLSLLESNTGKIKTRALWNSKYYPVGKADMSMLPFMRTLLMLFGDRSLIIPTVFKLRQQIIDTAIKRHWTPFTTRDKVIVDLESEIKEPYVLSVIRSIP